MNMRLELQKFHVREIVFGSKTVFEKGTLTINKEELSGLLAEDKHFSGFKVELVKQGENTRIVNIADVIEPRARRDGRDWPGILDKAVGVVGNGKTDVLSGCALVLIHDSGGSATARGRSWGSIIDMTGPGADICIFSKTHNICIIPEAAQNIDIKAYDYRLALKTASLKASVYLAACCKDLVPDEVEVCELPSLTDIAKGSEDLPRFVYIWNFYRYYEKDDSAIYGKIYNWMPSMLLHPNEIYDGAVVCPTTNMASSETYTIQNHPIIKELYKRHGKDWLFLGVIPTVAMLEDCDVQSQMTLAVKLALQMGATGAVLTKAPGGSPMVDIATFAVNASEYGIKSVLVIDDMAAALPDGRFKVNGIIFTDPKASAIVTTGNTTEPCKLSAVDRVVGLYTDGAEQAITARMAGIAGHGTQLGNSMIMDVKY